MEGLWNDLHYYALTLKNSKVRDAIISILVANDFYFKVISKSGSMTEDFVRGVAQARVILDLKPARKSEPPKETGAPSKEEKAEILKRHNYLTAKANLHELNQFKKEILKAQEIFEQGEGRRRKEADEEYDEALAAAYARATYTERVVTDPDTGKTAVVKEYIDLVLPDYSDFYVRPEDELTITTPKIYYSQNTISFVSELKTDYQFLTYGEVLGFLNKEIESFNDMLLENSSTPKNLVVFNGIPFQRQSSKVEDAEQTSYLTVGLIPLPQKETYYVLIENLDAERIDSIEYTLSIPEKEGDKDIEETVFNSFCLDKPFNGVTLLLEDKIEIETASVSLNGTITLINGDRITFEINDRPISSFTKGITVPIEVERATDPTITQVQIKVRKIYGLTQLGIADYRKVEQEVCCYVPGEVSHIENIMAREYKSRSNTRRKLTEITETTTREMESEQLTDTTMTDRFEMNQEIAVITSQDTAVAVNAGVWYNGGAYGGSVDGSFASNTSTEESNHQAITHAKEITERALDRVVQKVKEERIEKVIEEFTDSNVHEFDNTKGDNHISGVYRWVDKIYMNKLINYGKRLMYEFMIPEPSSFHNEAILPTNSVSEIELPIDPRNDSNNPLVLISANPFYDFASKAKYWAEYYNAEIPTLPDFEIHISRSFSKEGVDHWAMSGEFNIDIPEDYRVISAKGYLNTAKTGEHSDGNGQNWTRISIGGNYFPISETEIGNGSPFRKYEINAIGLSIRNSIGISLASWRTKVYGLELTLKCSRNPEVFEQWKNETFHAIIEKYEEAKAAYDEKMEKLRQQVEEKMNINPGFYRKIEKDVLRKNCMAYIFGGKGLGHDTFIKNRTDGNDTQTIAVNNNSAMEQYASKVKFLEQAFEWDIMSYYFYPFYWAEKSTWSEKYQIQNDDPLFRAFLQSGMARVIVTVRPGFEEAVNWFIATGQVWNGGQVPVINDENFLDIVSEIREPEGEVEETWETRVPTSLTVIQAGTIGLDVEGLPCNEECGGSGDNPIGQQPDVFLENEKTAP